VLWGRYRGKSETVREGSQVVGRPESVRALVELTLAQDESRPDGWPLAALLLTRPSRSDAESAPPEEKQHGAPTPAGTRRATRRMTSLIA
jgi:hypothetical protein